MLQGYSELVSVAAGAHAVSHMHAIAHSDLPQTTMDLFMAQPTSEQPIAFSIWLYVTASEIKATTALPPFKRRHYTSILPCDLLRVLKCTTRCGQECMFAVRAASAVLRTPILLNSCHDDSGMAFRVCNSTVLKIGEAAQMGDARIPLHLPGL